MKTGVRSETIRAASAIALSAVLALAASAASMLIGPVEIGIGDVARALLSWTGMTGEAEVEIRNIVLNIRLPRAALAALVGGGLSAAGVIFQVMLRNVLAEPYILGVSGGAAVGALTAMVTGLGALFAGAIPLSAFAGASATVALVYALGRQKKADGGDTLLLIGVMAGAFCSAVILVMVSIMGDPVRNALFWLLGYLGNSTAADAAIAAPITLAAAAYLAAKGRTYNILALGGEQAEHLGVNVRGMVFSSYMIASLLTAVLVSFSGSIGFVGLIVPHTVRLIGGPDHRILLPVSFFSGAVFLEVCDILARTLLSPAELPVGAVTAAIGAPLFIGLLLRKK